MIKEKRKVTAATYQWPYKGRDLNQPRETVTLGKENLTGKRRKRRKRKNRWWVALENHLTMKERGVELGQRAEHVSTTTMHSEHRKQDVMDLRRGS